MQPATSETVLGNFDSSQFAHFGVVSTFYRRDGAFLVTTDSPEGNLQDYEVAFTFGVTPLQQYLVEFPGGRYQVLPLCWDSRAESDGGQRWFHIYPEESIPAGDLLHWTGANQNWNFQCADCHSTNLRKNYDYATDSYETTWSEVNVSCEACHGPGSGHVVWAEANEQGEKLESGNYGPVLSLKPAGSGDWIFHEGSPTAHWSGEGRSSLQVESCAPCHSRRMSFDDSHVPGQPLLDTYLPQLLTEGMYFPDGQIQDEVYVYGSFLQSKMYRSGVVCSDCHNPHSGQTLVEGNALCARCHMPSEFDTPEHHFHASGTDGANCVDCHMPERTYMVVDPRRDHSIRIPRPDLTISLGSPNVCNRCHDDRTPEWASEQMLEWYGSKPRQAPHYGEILHAGRIGAPGSRQALAALATDTARPDIVRATALATMSPRSDSLSAATLLNALDSPEPLLRLAALSTFGTADPVERYGLLRHLLEDSIRAIRNEAGRLLAPAFSDSLPESERSPLQGAMEEYVQAQRHNGERPGAYLNLGNLYAEMGQTQKAERFYKEAIRKGDWFVPAYVNLADLYRSRGEETESEAILNQAIAVNPDAADAYHALGLLLVRRGDLGKALQSLQRAHTLEQNSANHAYVYGIALNSDGRTEEALTVMASALERSPYNVNLLYTLATMHRDAGELEKALTYAGRLVEVEPDNRGVRSFLQSLESGTR
jgi:tetratricopeptide (TPR) repeat protein